ncbi:MAG: glutathione S-transferase family protein [Rhodospirillaceae bacterium]|jgi:glutathione S-transferase|nr:glutathione S-transferase family protein [Rhodospirillaceae bacterium]MBT7956060.1 glutathione S-transferase family protein [Rhodospirillaceae bacterium]
MADIKIYGFAPSSYTWSTRLAAEEKGITHELLPVEFGSDPHKKLHPFAKIPIMEHGDNRLYETNAICRYIDEAFDGPALQPSDTFARAEMDQWISSIIDYYYDWCIRRIVVERIVVPSRGGETDEEKVADAIPHAAYTMKVANERLGKSDYLTGNDPSIADFMMVPVAFYLSQVPEAEKTIAGNSAVEAWLGRMQSRPSFAATVPGPPGS